MNILMGKGAAFTMNKKVGTQRGNNTKIDQVFYDSWQNPVVVKPGEKMFDDIKEKFKLGEFFISQDLYDAERKLENLRAELSPSGEIVKLGISGFAPGIGDVIMSTVIPKAFKEAFGTSVKVDYFTSPQLGQVLEGNPYIDKIYTVRQPNRANYTLFLDADSIEFKMQPSVVERERQKQAKTVERESPYKDGFRSRSGEILSKLGIWLVNRTPVLVLSKTEKEWAKNYLKKFKRKIIGIQLCASCASRTYLSSAGVVCMLEEEGFDSIILDQKNKDGSFKFTIRQAAAIINECFAVIVPDSGMLHIAGALRKRIIGLFGHTQGSIFTEDYEKAIVVQGECTEGKDLACWWNIPCVAGSSLKEKSKNYVPCLTEIPLSKIKDALLKHKKYSRKILIAMLTYNNLNMTKKALASIKSVYEYDIFVVDNESTDDTKTWLKEEGYNFSSKRCGVGEAQNIAIKMALEGDYSHLLLLNNDIVLRSDYINMLMEEQEKTGALAAVGTVVKNTAPWNVDIAEFTPGQNVEVSSIEAGDYSATLLTKKCLKEVGYFDEQFAPRYIEDNDYTLRIRLSGGKFIRTSSSQYYHALGAVVHSIQAEQDKHAIRWERNIQKFILKWGIHPHSDQSINRLGMEWYLETYGKRIIDRLEELLRGKNYIKVMVQRRMGGYGDIIFSTVLARALRQTFEDKVYIVYSVPEKFVPLLVGNPYINEIRWNYRKENMDFVIDITDLELRVELQEIQKFGEVKTPRTGIYLDLVSLNWESLKLPWYRVTPEEREWAKGLFGGKAPDSLIVIGKKGSNLLKQWHGMDELKSELLSKWQCTVMVLDDNALTFRQAVAVCSLAKCVVSPDTGISNASAAIGVPTVTLFSNRNGKVFAKMFETMIPVQGSCPYRDTDYCDFILPCFGEGVLRSKENLSPPECFNKLTVEKVLKAVKKVMNDD